MQTQIEVRLFTLPLPISTPLYGGARIGKKLYKGVIITENYRHLFADAIAASKAEAKKELAAKIQSLVPGAKVVWS